MSTNDIQLLLSRFDDLKEDIKEVKTQLNEHIEKDRLDKEKQADGSVAADVNTTADRWMDLRSQNAARSNFNSLERFPQAL
jgi:predicted nuclease with TOPRIM domain